MNFHGLLVRLRPNESEMSFNLRGGLVIASPTGRGDIAEIDILVPPEDLRVLPCAVEVGAALREIESGKGCDWLRLKNLPRPRAVPVSVEDMDWPPGAVFVRLAREEAPTFAHDILGDGSELVEYTRDGRILGIRLKSPGIGPLIPPVLAPDLHEDICLKLVAHGFSLDDLRPYLDGIDMDSPFRSIPPPPGRRKHAPGNAIIKTALFGRDRHWTLDDVHNDGRVLAWRAPSGGLQKLMLYEVSLGVDLAGVPEREYIEPILLHQGVRVVK